MDNPKRDYRLYSILLSSLLQDNASQLPLCQLPWAYHTFFSDTFELCEQRAQELLLGHQKIFGLFIEWLAKAWDPTALS